MLGLVQEKHLWLVCDLYFFNNLKCAQIEYIHFGANKNEIISKTAWQKSCKNFFVRRKPFGRLKKKMLSISPIKHDLGSTGFFKTYLSS